MSTKRVNAFLRLKELNFAEYYGNYKESTTYGTNSSGSSSSSSSSNSCQEATVITGPPDVQQHGAINVTTQSSSSVPETTGKYTISIRHGTFTWTNEDGVLGTDSPTIPDEDQDSGDLSSTSPWSLRDVNISIKPVRL